MNTDSNYYKDNLYSRQVGALGTNCMKHMSNISVLLIHLDTSGFETAKCLVLMGIKRLYIYDPRIPNMSHIGLNIALTKHNRMSIAHQTKKYLDTLNPFVDIIVVDNYYTILTANTNNDVQD